MKYSKYFRHQHAMGRSTWHFEWCTKYCYRIFNTEGNKNLCRIALQEAAKSSKVEILEMEVEPEHLHMIVEIPLNKTPIDTIRDLNSLSARILLPLSSKEIVGQRKVCHQCWKHYTGESKGVCKKSEGSSRQSITSTFWNPHSGAKRKSCPVGARACSEEDVNNRAFASSL